MRFAIIENEFGEVGVDEEILKTEKNSAVASKGGDGEGIIRPSEEIVEVLNGCICCTVRGDLVSALKRMHERVANFDAVIIETTGMADPAPVAQTFFVDEEVQKLYKLDGIITVCDAVHLVRHLDKEVAEGAENESVEQLAFADKVILNKCDLIGSGDADAGKKAEDEDCVMAGPEGLKIESGPSDACGVKNVEEHLPNVDGEHVHDDSVSSVAWKFPGMELNVNKLQRWIGLTIQQELGQDLYRYKGVLAVKGVKEKFVFQGVHMLFSGGFQDDLLWGDDEARECRVVFIGKKMKQEHGETLKTGFLACEAEKELRFKVGDTVKARVRGWQEAKVLRTWDMGNPYRLEVQDANKTNVWGPEDSDMCVRAA